MTTDEHRDYNMASDHDPMNILYAQHDGKTLLGDGREQELLQFIFNHPFKPRMHNSASTILAAIDEFGSKKYLMNIGPRKGVLMCNLITELKPNLMIELGGYIGYSAILFGDAIKKNGGQRYISIECNAEYAKVSRQLVELAGLSDVVKIEVGVSDGILRELAASEERAQKIDLLFIDHYKPAYTHDLKLCEELGLVGPGSTVAADNVIHPGAPEYLAYVRRSVEEKRQLAGDGRSEDAATEHPSNKNWYLKGEQKPAETLTTCVMGNSNLIYDSELIMSYEPNGIPDGIEISRCIGE